MIELLRNKNKFVYVLFQSLLFAIYWITLLNNSNLIVPIIFLSILFLYLVRDLLLVFLSLFLATSIMTVILEVAWVIRFFEGKNINLFYLITILFLILAVFVVSKIFPQEQQSKYDEKSLTAHAFLVILALQIFHRINLGNNQELSFKYLIATGEDNATWLSGLSSGFTSQGNYIFTESANSGGEKLTGLLAQNLRGLLNFGLTDSELSLNLVNLQRIYGVFLSLNIFIVTIMVFRICKNLKLNESASYAISFSAGLATYLSASSIAVYGHLPVLQTTAFIFAGISLLFFKTNEKNRLPINPAHLKTILFLFIAFAAAQSWYPIAPAIYLLILMVVASFLVPKIKSVIQKNALIASFFILIAAAGLLVIIFFQKVALISAFNKFVYLIHFPGGTMTPSNLQLIIYLITVALLTKATAPNLVDTSILKNTKLLLLALTSFYVLTVAVSVTTSPFSTSYAAAKLGMAIIIISLPITITLVGIKFFQGTKSIISSLAFFLASWGALFYLGAPSGPPSPAYNQFGFPFVLNNLISEKSAYNYEWINPLIGEISLKGEKRILCFESKQGNFDSENARICTRFAAGIQGFEREPIRELWERVNLNSIPAEELSNQLPSDFEAQYKIFRTDSNFDSTLDPNQIQISNLFAD